MTQTPWWHDDEDPAGRSDAATEAARLFEVLRDRLLTDPTTLRAGMKIMEGLSLLGGQPGGAAPGEAPECAYCPVCQAIRQARSVSPETVERLTGVALEFAETVRRTLGDDPDRDTGDDSVRHVPLDDDEPGFGGWTDAPSE